MGHLSISLGQNLFVCRSAYETPAAYPDLVEANIALMLRITNLDIPDAKGIEASWMVSDRLIEPGSLITLR